MSSDYELNVEQKSSEPSRLALVLTAIKKGFLWIPRKLRIVMSIILGAVFIIFLLVAFKPIAEKRDIPETVVTVDVVELTKSTYPIVVNANGTVEAETRGNLVAQIRGEIVSVSNNFKTGGTFKKGDVLIQIDPRDYQADLSRALANLSQAEAAYRQEQATAKQAKQDWQRLGNKEAAPDLVLRKPQLTAAKAAFDSALAAKQTAQLNLNRTTLTAPYDGRVITRQAVLGQYVSVGAPVAEVFATDGVEVRLPISQEEFSQLGLDSFDPNNNQFDVVVKSETGSNIYQWEAQIRRTDSTFDINTRQIDVIAEVIDPFGKGSQQPALKIGQFVTARIQGRSVEDVYVVPNKSIREGRYIYAVRDEKLAKQSIKILWQDDQNALVSEGLSSGELVVTTSLNSTLAGARAKLNGNRSEASKATAVDPQSNDKSVSKPASNAKTSAENENETAAPAEVDSSLKAVDLESTAAPDAAASTKL
jgi:RND family efflux transporter MFP subunit